MDQLIIFALAFGVSLASTPLIRKAALRFGIIDRPAARKIHRVEVPYLGGVAFFLTLLVVVLTVIYAFPAYWPWCSQFVSLIAGALMVLLLGLYDDVRGASAAVKLPCQILIAVFMYNQGFSIGRLSNPFDFAGVSLNVSSIGVVVTALWYVALMNAVNLIDGLDGLAAGVVAIAAGTLFMIALSDQNLPVALLSLILVGGTLGFLPYNFPPARIFMGDTGSLLLGFLIASAAVMGETKGSTLVAMVVPMIALGISLLDTTLAFIRRLLQRKHPFRADQQHIHHRLLKLGLSQKQVVIVIYYCSILFGLASYLLSQVRIQYSLLTLLILGLSLFLGILILGFVERLARQRNHSAEPNEPCRIQGPSANGADEEENGEI